jgi:GT2 family glycosyltransferase
MDADDVALPHRLEKQLAFLREHPEVVCVGCHVALTDPYGVEFADVRQPSLSLDHDAIVEQLFRGNGWAMVHPSVMMRRDAVEEVGRYRKEFQHAEDIDLYLRLAEHGGLANLPDVLHRYRQHLTSINHTRREEQIRVITAGVAAAYQRKGAQLPPGWQVRWPEPPRPWKQHYDWAWRAMEVSRKKIARAHAFTAVRQEPFNLDSWRVLYCVLRGR